MLAAGGVKTYAVLSHFFFNTRFGMNRGWDRSVWADPFKTSVNDSVALEALENLLASGPLPSPFFLYVHLMGAHAPYAPPVSAREQIASRLLSPSVNPISTTKLIKNFQAGKIKKIKKCQLRDLVGLYRSDAVYHDTIMKKLLSRLDEKGIMERAIFIYTSDHGEEFFEHGGLGHARSLWSEQIDVPLFVHLPGQEEGARIESLVGHIDLAPTILSAFGMPVPGEMHGMDLMKAIENPDAALRATRGLLVQHWTGISGVRLGKFKLLRLSNSSDILTVEVQGKETKLSPSDYPITLRLLRKTETSLVRQRASAIEKTAKGGSLPAAEDAQIDEETRRQLEKLGYILDN